MKIWKIAFGIAVVFIATFTLFYIFDSISKLGEDCETASPKPAICESLSGATLNMILLLLIVGGFLFAILTISYILLSP